MKHFIAGVIATIVVAAGVTLFLGYTGRIDLRADRHPGALESSLAMSFLDASVGRQVKGITNPLPAVTANIVAGARTYRQHCAVCHGDPAAPNSPLADTLYPPPPQFFVEPTDMSEAENHFIILHGVRWAGMPGWENVLNDQQIWQLTTFLSHTTRLPPQAKAVFDGGHTPSAAGPTAMPKP